MTRIPNHHSTPDTQDPAASRSLLPVLLWLNRRELASRFPDWHPHPQPSRTGKAP